MSLSCASLLEYSLEPLWKPFREWPTYLANQFGILGVCYVILSEVSMKPITEIQIFVVQRDKNICYQTCRKTHEKKNVIASLWVRSYSIKKKKRKTNPGVQLNGILAQMKGDYDIAVFKSILCLSQYWLPLYLYKKNSCRFMSKISNHFHHAGSTNHYIFFLVIFGIILSSWAQNLIKKSNRI